MPQQPEMLLFVRVAFVLLTAGKIVGVAIGGHRRAHNVHAHGFR